MSEPFLLFSRRCLNGRLGVKKYVVSQNQAQYLNDKDRRFITSHQWIRGMLGTYRNREESSFFDGEIDLYTR